MPKGLLTHIGSARRWSVWCETKRSEHDVAIPHKRDVTQIAPVLIQLVRARPLFFPNRSRSQHM